MYETKVCSSGDLLLIATMADKHDFNRRVETERLVTDIDPNGVNILQCLMPYHRASFGLTPKDKPPWPDHHRCYVYCKVKDSDEPATFFLDVEVSIWDRLKTLEQLKEAMNDPLEMSIARARASALEDEYEE